METGGGCAGAFRDRVRQTSGTIRRLTLPPVQKHFNGVLPWNGGPAVKRCIDNYDTLCYSILNYFSYPILRKEGKKSAVTRIFACLLVATALSCLACAGTAQTVKVDPNGVEVPSWEGWGCSICWWGIFSKHWSDAQRRELCRLIFSHDKDALGWNIARYNAGGTAADADVTRYRPGADARVILDQDGSWHPERDKAQIDCLLLARKFGANRLELFVNSPPYWMLKNGNTRGADDGKDNLKESSRRDYSRWLTSLLVHFEKDLGIRFDYVSPFNEPSAWWWNGKTGGQEGCKLDWPAQADVLRYLKEDLAAAHLTTKPAASDENGAHEAYNTLNWLTEPDKSKGAGLDASYLPKLNVHAYNGWEWQDRLRELAAARRIQTVWMSEVSHRESENAGFVPYDMRCALPETRSVVSDIRRLRCSAWIYWEAIEPLQADIAYHFTYGFLPTSVDSDVTWNGRVYHPGDFVVTKSFYALRQFAAFIRPKACIVHSGDDWTLAALTPDRHTLTIVVHNDKKESKPYSFDLSLFGHAGASAKPWRTMDDAGDEKFNCRPLASISVHDKAFSDTIPARSVTTYVISEMKL